MNYARDTTVFSAIMLAGWAATIALDPSEQYRWISLTVLGAGVGVGIFELRNARRAVKEFEGRHGSRAGLQD